MVLEIKERETTEKGHLTDSEKKCAKSRVISCVCLEPSYVVVACS